MLKILKLICFTIVICLALTLSISTKKLTMLEAEFGSKVYKFLSPIVIHWRIDTLGDVKAYSDVHVLEYISTKLNDEHLSNLERRFYMRHLMEIGEVVDKQDLDEELIHKMLTDSAALRDLERFLYLLNFFNVKDLNKVYFRSFDGSVIDLPSFFYQLHEEDIKSFMEH